MLIGNAVDGSVYTVMPGRNLARDPGRHFVLDAGTLLAADSEARAVGQEIVGFYHSHPRSGPAPSPVDYELAWPATVQLIVKVNRGVPAACAWCIEQGLVTPCYFQFLP